MYRNFSEIEKSVIAINGKRARIALANAQDIFSLDAIVQARQKGIIEAVLIGEKDKIVDLLLEFQESPADYVIIPEYEEKTAVEKAVHLVKNGDAEIPMKGLMQTATFMHAILDKEKGLLSMGALLSEATVFFHPDDQRLLIVTDCAVNITPGVEDKIKIIRNAVKLANIFGVTKPKVAAITAQEHINEKIPGSVDAALLSASDFGYCDCMVAGPLALDNAVSLEAAQHKGIEGDVAGNADILLMPDLISGNVIHKTLHYFAHLPTAAALLGLKSPIIMTSRTDSKEDKYNSILIAVLQVLDRYCP